MNPRQFLLWGGTILIVVGILGFIPGIIGPTPQESLFGSFWWFDNGENWAHLIIGVVGVIAAYALDMRLRRYLVLALGVIAIFFGIYSIFTNAFLGANLENPADTILHLAIGVWALLAGMRKEERI